MKCTVKIDENLQKELNFKSWLIYLIFTIIGSVGLLAYIVIGMFTESQVLEFILWISAFAFAFGIVMILSIKKINKKAIANGFIDTLEFEQDFCIEKTSKNDEVISTLKVYYKDLIKLRETKNYLFLYVNQAGAIPLPKNAFSNEEFETIKSWIDNARLEIN